MKSTAFLLLTALLFASCLGYKEMPVEYDYSYRGNFKRYRTFEILMPEKDSAKTVGQVQSAIASRMKFLGYRQTANRPHLLIGFKIFDDSVKLGGYAQPKIEDWVKSQRVDLDYQKQEFGLHTGTLLIQFFDRRQNRSVWQGYATTQYGSIDFQSSRHLRNAVISILDKYRFWADGFMENENQPTAEP